MAEGAPRQDDGGLKVKQQSKDDLMPGKLHFGGNGRKVVSKTKGAEDQDTAICLDAL